MNIFVAKKMMYCQEYDESLQKCTLCQNNSITKMSTSNQILCWRKVPGCNDTYDNNTGACESCQNDGLIVDKNGYDASGNRSMGDYCVTKVENCRQYDVLNSDYPCMSCEEKYNLTDGICAMPIPNCKVQDGYKCIQCEENYTNQDLLCYSNIPHCASFSVTKLDTCASCENNYNLTENKSNCAPSIENCASYSSETLHCTYCTDEYTLSNYECESKMSKTMIVLITLSSLLSLIGVTVILVYCYRKWKMKDDDDDFKMVNVALEEETIQKRTLIMLEEDKIPKLEKFIDDVKKSNNITRYHLIEESENFTDLREIKRTQELGKGLTAVVWDAHDMDGKEYALKVFVEKSKDFYYNPAQTSSFKNMVKEYKNICVQEGVVTMKGIAYSNKNGLFTLGIVLEKMDFDLLKLLESNKKLSFETKLDISVKITEALIFFHQLFVHHDLKLKNILLREKENEYEVKISDFGTCLKKNPEAGDDNNIFLKNLTYNYASPENILHILVPGCPLTNKPSSDVWSLGLVFYKIFVGIEKEKQIIFPWKDYVKKKEDNHKLSQIIVEEHVKLNEYFNNSVVGADIPESIVELINQCLQVDFETRISLEEIWKKLRKMKESSRRDTNLDLSSQGNLEENLL